MIYIEHTIEPIVLLFYYLISMLHIKHTNQLHYMWSKLKYNVLIGRVDVIMF